MRRQDSRVLAIPEALAKDIRRGPPKVVRDVPETTHHLLGAPSVLHPAEKSQRRQTGHGNGEFPPDDSPPPGLLRCQGHLASIRNPWLLALRTSVGGPSSFRIGSWCRRSDSNRHGSRPPTVFETAASAIPPLRLDKAILAASPTVYKLFFEGVEQHPQTPCQRGRFPLEPPLFNSIPQRLVA